MKYQRIRRFSGDLILARVTAANTEETLCTMAMEEEESDCILDYISQSRENHFQPPNSQPSKRRIKKRENTFTSPIAEARSTRS